MFLKLLGRSSEIYQVDVLAFVLMTNHFHLVVKTPLANLQEFMRHFNISYTASFNRNHHRVGHLYQGRYKSFLIDADRYLMEVTRYIHLNPVRIRKNESLSTAALSEYLNSYRWSSYSDYIGKKAYGRFVESGLTEDIVTPLGRGRGHGIIGDESFIEGIRRRYLPLTAMREVPALRNIERHLSPQRIIDTIATVTGTQGTTLLERGHRGLGRVIAMELLYRYGGLTQREIGALMGVDYSSVSVGRKRFRILGEKDKEVLELAKMIQTRLIQE